MSTTQVPAYIVRGLLTFEESIFIIRKAARAIADTTEAYVICTPDNKYMLVMINQNASSDAVMNAAMAIKSYGYALHIGMQTIPTRTQQKSSDGYVSHYIKYRYDPKTHIEHQERNLCVFGDIYAAEMLGSNAHTIYDLSSNIAISLMTE